MPLWEALYSGIPAVAPNSTAMGEFLPQHGVRLFEVSEMPVLGITSSFGAGFKKNYGEPGITVFEPDVESAAAAIASSAINFEKLKEEALKNRDKLVLSFSYERMGSLLSDSIDKALLTK